MAFGASNNSIAATKTTDTSRRIFPLLAIGVFVSRHPLPTHCGSSVPFNRSCREKGQRRRIPSSQSARTNWRPLLQNPHPVVLELPLSPMRYI
ncbi:hypothetical protein L915_02085 [Phytophthora nicotianae]|uniref:Uncharacterized protein n=1 Tax=Phytophthora nicotianae TaxID=4792 RepID=W2HKF6_PHYNI|nr:hypothetical protein L915_02085 [Phytophthora nicotianae]